MFVLISLWEHRVTLLQNAYRWICLSICLTICRVVGRLRVRKKKNFPSHSTVERSRFQRFWYVWHLFVLVWGSTSNRVLSERRNCLSYQVIFSEFPSDFLFCSVAIRDNNGYCFSLSCLFLVVHIINSRPTPYQFTFSRSCRSNVI